MQAQTVDPHLSHARGIQAPPLIERTIGDFFDDVAQRQPRAPALICRHENVRLTYEALQQQSRQLASALLAAGLRPGDRLGIWSPNGSAWALLQFATARIGIILVNINPAYRPAEADYALNLTGCRGLVTAPRFKSSEYLKMLRELTRARLPRLERIWWIDREDAPDEPGGDIPLQRFTELLAQGEADDPRVRHVQKGIRPDDPVNIQFTSGTTGYPKGATLTHRNMINNAFFVGERMRLGPDDRLCIPVPLYHCIGMVLGNLSCVTHGSTMVYPSEGFDAQAVLQTVHDERCTALHGVPTMFIAELQHPRFREFDLSSLRTGIMAGAPCPVEIMKRVVGEMHMSEITIAYGMTETSPVSCQSSTDTTLERRVGTVGTVLPHLEVRIVDPDTGETTAHGASGELCVRGYSVMPGYWEDPAATARAIDAEGWMHTGDLATMDAEGYVNIVGRIKDMVIRGGENIYPREIEEMLYHHPKIQDVQVVGLPDHVYGEELCAWIIVRAGQQLDEDDVRAFCRERMAHFKVPRYIRFVEEFPMTVSGKIQKFRIREQMSRELGLTKEQTA